jgi:very-short-patch-repair endonuclease
MFVGEVTDRSPSHVCVANAREKLAQLLQSRSLSPHRFIRHASIGPFVVEQVCPDRGVIVEVHRGETRAGQRLQSRPQLFRTLGFKVVLVKRADILERPQDVLAQVLDALG